MALPGWSQGDAARAHLTRRKALLKRLGAVWATPWHTVPRTGRAVVLTVAPRTSVGATAASPAPEPALDRFGIRGSVD